MSGLFSTPQQAPAIAPTPAAPAPMPDPNSAAVQEARMKAQSDIMSRAGRTSTILTAPKDRGGSDYGSTQLGAGN